MWGIGTAWLEIEHLLAACHGKILDIACGTKGISDGIDSSKLTVCDATKTPYSDGEFDYSYSLGSLEHFTEDGIIDFLFETRRITGKVTFHQIPTSRSGKDEGWLVLQQSYFNNSVGWWLQKFRRVYPAVRVLDSRWEDGISAGKWFVCEK